MYNWITIDALSFATINNTMAQIIDTVKTSQWNTKIKINYTDGTSSTIIKDKTLELLTFRGKNSKNLLKLFVNETINYPEFGFTKIVQILDKNGFRQFVPIKNWKNFWKKYKNIQIKSRFLFEVILSNFPCKPYLDIEWKITEKYQEETQFVDQLIADIIYLFHFRYNIIINRGNIMITKSHSPSKVSFHVVVTKIYDDNSCLAYNTNKKGLDCSAWDFYLGMISLDNKYKLIIDESVYSLDREFRAIYSNKCSNDFRPFVPINANDITQDMLVPLTTKQSLKYIVTDINKHRLINVQPDATYLACNIVKKNIASLCKNKCHQNDFQFEENIKKYLTIAKQIHPTAFYTGWSPTIQGYRFSYTDKTEPCYSGKIHDSNGFYVIENSRGFIGVKCMSSQCPANKNYLKTPQTERAP